MTIGSIEHGVIVSPYFPGVSLGANNLTVGSNNLSTTFSGVIGDGSLGGSLTKIGKGKLVLSGENTYSRGTAIKGGKLVINNEPVPAQALVLYRSMLANSAAAA